MKEAPTLHQIVPTPAAERGSSDIVSSVRRSQRIGEILVAGGKLTPEQVESVLHAQQGSDRRFGEIAVQKRFVSRREVDEALALQFGYSSGKAQSSAVSGLTSIVSPDAPFAEALRGLRSQLMMRWFDGTPGQTALAITSVDRGDGKSFITANLGVAFSQLEERTLIIDADLRHSVQHKQFGLRNRMGLSGILSGRAGFEEIVDIDNMANLSVLPSGPQPPNPLELLGRDAFPILLNELSNRFNVILIDTPSAQQAADALVVAKRAKASLIVGRKDRTKGPELAQLASILSSSGVALLGTTLNEY
ncbi:MAG: polysaccharide biosynthesis tyrosine autokinase [Burkholderiaceae bacterium]|nr:polysaccharide biosynthesis tyrosine autokinase [Burkholderiaceae bacterium]